MSARRRKQRKHFSQRGIALMAVSTIVTIIGVISVEFSTNTQIESFGAYNSSDRMRAEFLARSSLNLSELVIRLQQVLDNPDVKEQLGTIQITDYADMFMAAFGGDAQEVADTVGLAGDDAKGFGAEIGRFGASITSDDGKINVNCANASGAKAEVTYTLVDTTYFFPAFDPVFQDEDAEGWRRDRRTQTQSIVDFIDSDRNQATVPGDPKSTAGEDYGYESRPDKYEAKNNYLDTIDELKLARGVDDRFWTLFGPAFTVYGGCKLNIRSVEDPRIIAVLLYLTAKNQDDPVLRDGNLLWYHALAVAWARQNGFAFETTKDFVDFVKDPEGKLNADLASMLGAGGDAAAAAAAAPPTVQIPGIPQGIDLGLELNQTNVDNVLRAGPQRTYRVEVYGEVTRPMPFNPIRSDITAVWDMGNINNNQRSTDPKARNGSWVYFRSSP